MPKDYLYTLRSWLGIAGVSPQESPAVRKLGRSFEFGLLIIAIWLPIEWYLESRSLLSLELYNITNWLIWLAFLAETLVLTCVCQRKVYYLASNWINIAIIILLFPLFWTHFYLATIVRILRLGLMFRFLLPWLEFSTEFLSRNHLGTTLLVAVLLTTGGGLMMASIDSGVPSAMSGIWWAWQTITSVGYGDVVPTTTLGRVLGICVMIFGVGLLAMLTANFSAFFIARRDKSKQKTLDDIHDTLIRLEQKLEVLEKRLQEKI